MPLCPMRQIVDEAERKIGSGYVYTATDGKVYGSTGDQWYRLFEGKGEKIKKAMQKQYGKERGERVFYASENKGSIKGVAKKGSKK